VLLGAVLGIIVGLTLPAVGIALKPLNDYFIALVKMIVIPVIFCILATGIASMDNLRKAGRIGVKALGYFLVLSLLSMLIGLLAGNIFQPGAGMNIDPATLDPSGARVGHQGADAVSRSSRRISSVQLRVPPESAGARRGGRGATLHLPLL
jgi:aerobic C4-dicarboxylate transport protein